MHSRIRILLFIEAAGFLIMSLVHAGRLLAGYEHGAAALAETVIGVVLLGACGITWLRPADARAAGLLAQTFALVATLAGVFTIIVGIGPRTALDAAFHTGILMFLAWGLSVTIAPFSQQPERSESPADDNVALVTAPGESRERV